MVSRIDGELLLRINPRLLLSARRGGDLLGGDGYALRLYRLRPKELELLQEEMLYGGAEVQTEGEAAVVLGTTFQIESGCGRLAGRGQEGEEIAGLIRETLRAAGKRRFELPMGEGRLELGERTLLMGVLNVTPDSFYDGGRLGSTEEAIERGIRMAEQGAGIVDVGGESTRPGAEPVPPEEEIRRVEPVVQGLSSKGVRVSIDTRNPQTARAALEAGARMINDVTALENPEMASLAAETGVPVVLMHMQGTPRTMQAGPRYDDLMEEITAFLRDRAMKAERAGVRRDSILIDPGIGFGKRLEHNVEILRRLPELCSLGFPVLVGPSRKSFIGKLLDGRPADERLFGTLGAVAACVGGGAHAVRVHDVPEVRDAVQVLDRIRQS